MTEIQITATYIGILTLFMLVLGARVSVLRRKHRVSMGTGDHPDLQRAVRAFGNFAEWVPMIVVALVACEVAGAPAFLIHLVGIAVILGRLAHVVGLRADRATMPRTIGVLLTWLSALVAGGYLIFAAI
ncbi:MAG: MAPEG family protein [Alphaproteobacteria bacterium]|nr:MAPEG family protein [Alphaproteobacteria bacterium]